QGWPFAACLWNGDGANEPGAKRRAGWRGKRFWLLLSRLTKVTRPAGRNRSFAPEARSRYMTDVKAFAISTPSSAQTPTVTQAHKSLADHPVYRHIALRNHLAITRTRYGPPPQAIPFRRPDRSRSINALVDHPSTGAHRVPVAQQHRHFTDTGTSQSTRFRQPHVRHDASRIGGTRAVLRPCRADIRSHRFDLWPPTAQEALRLRRKRRAHAGIHKLARVRVARRRGVPTQGFYRSGDWPRWGRWRHRLGAAQGWRKVPSPMQAMAPPAGPGERNT